MADKILTISDRSKFNALIEQYVSKNEIILKSSAGDIKVQYIGYAEGKLALRIPRVKKLPERITVNVTVQSSILNAVLELTGSFEDTFTFNPLLFQIISDQRRENRFFQDDEQSKNLIYLSGYISDDMINYSINSNFNRTKKIEETINFELNRQFERIKIYFLVSGKNDLRMSYFIERPEPLFVPEFKSAPSEKMKETYDYYMKHIHSRDPVLSGNSEFTSEISVPILFRNTILLGYILVNSKTRLREGHIEVIKRMAVVVNELLKKESIIKHAPEKFLVTDLSKSGIGIAFREKVMMRYFREGSIVCFESLLPTRKKISVGGRIANIMNMKGDIVKIGMEITNLDDNNRQIFYEYLDKM